MGYTHPTDEERRKETKWQKDKVLAAALEAEIFRNFTREEQDDFFNKCRKLKIDKFDIELFRLLSMLQYQKRHLEDIPREIEKHKKELDGHMEEVKKLSGQVNDSANVIEKNLEKIKEVAAQTVDPIAETAKTAEQVVETTANNLHKVMRKSLEEIEQEANDTMGSISDCVYSRIHHLFTDIDENFENDFLQRLELNIGKINQSLVRGTDMCAKLSRKMKQEAKALNTDIDAMRKMHKSFKSNLRKITLTNWRVYAVATLVFVLCSWALFHGHYKMQVAEVKQTAIRRIGQNQEILTSLAKSDRVIEQRDSDKKGYRSIVIRNAEGWTSTNKHGVIDYKE
jgi:hypothetical protein